MKIIIIIILTVAFCGCQPSKKTKKITKQELPETNLTEKITAPKKTEKIDEIKKIKNDKKQTEISVYKPLLNFRGMPDNRIAVRTFLGFRSARVISSNIIEAVFGISINDICSNPDAYRIISFTDDNYAYKKFVRPIKASVKKEKEMEATPGCGFPSFDKTIVNLTLPFSMKPGNKYYVIAQAVGPVIVTATHTAQNVFYPAKPLSANEIKSQEIVSKAVLGLRKLESVGNKIIALEFGPNFCTEKYADTENYFVKINNEKVDIKNIGRISKVDCYIPYGWPFVAIPRHMVFLELAKPIVNGDKISVKVKKELSSGARGITIRFNPKKSFSSSIKVNQIGYLTDSPVKTAYLGRWLGSFPEKEKEKKSLDFSRTPEFNICRSDNGKIVFSGNAKLVHRARAFDEGVLKVDYSGENVYQLDFTKFKTPGKYFISVPDVGRSLEFKIDNDIYEKAFKIQSYGVFAQRCGMELKPPFSSWRRIACHTNGIQPLTQHKLDKHNWSELDQFIDVSKKKINATGGHHDAGDYNPRSHIDVAQALMDVYEISPEKFYDGQLNIPEKNNGIPDIIDEAAWALKLWIELQDADGGVFNGTESNGDPNFGQTVELDTLGDFAYAKDAAGSFTFAAVAAQMSRILKSINKNAEAEKLLDKALKAYAWGETNPPKNINSFNKYRSPKAYAAAELLLTTKKPKFNKDFLDVCVWKDDLNAPLFKYKVYDQSRAAWAFARCVSGNSKIRKAVRKNILSNADYLINNAKTMGYSFIKHPTAPISWGTGALPVWLEKVIWAYYLSGKEKYKYWIVKTCDNTLGANPLNRSFVVGLGQRCVRAPLHNSRYSHFGEVVNGMQAQGPNQAGNDYRIRETSYPKIDENFASLQTFADCHFAIEMDEGTAGRMAKTMAAFGMLLPEKKSKKNSEQINNSLRKIDNK